MTIEAEGGQRIALGIAGGQRRAFEHQIKTMEQAFRLAKPDARQRAVRLRDRAQASVGRLAAAAEFARARAERARAEGAPGEASRHDRRAAYLDSAATGYEQATAHIDRLIAEHGRGLAMALDSGPTPERLVQRVMPDGLMRLVATGAVDFGHLRAATEIARIYELSTIEVRAATLVPGPGVRGRRPDLDNMPDFIAERRRQRYLPWLRDMETRQDIDLAVVLDVVVHGLSLEAARKRHRIGWRRVRDMLVEALGAYARLQTGRT